MCRKTLVDEVARILTNHLASMPIGNARVADCILCEAIETLAEGLVIKPLGGAQLIMRRRLSAVGERSNFRTSQGH